ncbi:transcriptional regulator NosR [Alkalilimnicola ehrlichii MLHE-1]|uniref:transcriptional regulator NosR n=1 Tax=Alkalilimnicola ehrlichii TaxID=351052 RepID=UPI001E42F428|nr:NosR/NirI family protein [Alkalilimnicola ehrlichii]
MTALLLLPFSGAWAADWLEDLFPGADEVGEPEGDPPVIPLFSNGEKVGYAFETVNFAPIGAYSGKPVNMRVGLDLNGKITGAQLLDHSEPIVLIGVPDSKLVEFLEQYEGLHVTDRVRVGGRDREGYIGVDSVSSATVTVVVMGDSIMRSARMVARERGIVEVDTAALREPATVREDIFEPATWQELIEMGALGHLHITLGDRDDAFVGTRGEGIDEAPEERRDETLIELFYAYVNVPTVGRNLLGDDAYERMMARLEEGEHLIAVMATDESNYSFKGDGWVRGGVFDRMQIVQGDETVQFHDRDLIRLYDVAIDGQPPLDEKELFIVRQEAMFDPAEPIELELLVRREVGPVDRMNARFFTTYQVPEHFLDIPEPPPSLEEDDTPLWLTVWEDRVFGITVLGLGLGLLTLILLFQDVLARRPRLLYWIRHGFLVYTVGFIGYYTLAQLSVVNVLTFMNSLFTDFQWSTFLMDPYMFILWSFVAVTVLLWGRGVFCGWLCPFGAMQELINEVARKLRVPQFELPFAVHERLWALKYIILLGLFAVSLHSLIEAERYAEIEPFKTAISMQFMREWAFVLYAVGLLVVGVFMRKAFCRYVCPLGAALAIPARIRLFDWLRRHQECGSPCQICANECEVQAIHPDGHINANECHYCLDCQVTYWNDRKCPPMIVGRKRREKAARQAEGRANKAFPDLKKPQEA